MVKAHLDDVHVCRFDNSLRCIALACDQLKAGAQFVRFAMMFTVMRTACWLRDGGFPIGFLDVLGFSGGHHAPPPVPPVSNALTPTVGTFAGRHSFQHV